MLLFFIAHGTSMAVGFRLKRERDPARIRALLDLSSWSLGVAPSIAFVVGLLAGIAAGIMGGWFGQAWIWIALVLFVVVAGVMTPMVAARLNVIRAAAGTPADQPVQRRPPKRRRPRTRLSCAGSSKPGTRSRPPSGFGGVPRHPVADVLQAVLTDPSDRPTSATVLGSTASSSAREHDDRHRHAVELLRHGRADRQDQVRLAEQDGRRRGPGANGLGQDRCGRGRASAGRHHHDPARPGAPRCG